MRIELISVPYDSGRRGERMGRGPEALLGNGLVARLRALRHEVDATIIETTVSFPAEAAVAFDLAQLIAGRVREVRERGGLPVVLAGNCMSALGTVAGVGGGEATAVVWLDAHADCNTPETSTSAFLDGMALAVLTGRCWTAAAAAVLPLTLAERSVVLAGVRDLDPAEAKALERAELTLLAPSDLRAGDRFAAALEALPSTVRSICLHVDLDVLDPEAVGPANGFAAAGGITLDVVLRIVDEITRTGRLAAVDVCAYDPAVDADGAVAEAASAIIAACASR